MKRIAIYTFWDKEGILHQYHMQYLLGLKEIADTVLLVANGELTQESRVKLDDKGIKWLIRENKGLDFSAWKAGLYHLGAKFVRRVEELILCNCSCYGPLFPFSNAFEKMASLPCDFWGIYRQPKHPDGLYPSHIQSFFYVFRQAVLKSESFWDWWKNLKPSSSYEEEILEHETVFTAYLEKQGFCSDTLMSVKKYDGIISTGLATLYYGDVMVMDDKCPLIKRKYMFRKDANIHQVISHISKYTCFDMKDICRDIEQHINISAIKIIKYYIKFIFYTGKKKEHAKKIFQNMYTVWKCKGHTQLFEQNC